MPWPEGRVKLLADAVVGEKEEEEGVAWIKSSEAGGQADTEACGERCRC